MLIAEAERARHCQKAILGNRVVGDRVAVGDVERAVWCRAAHPSRRFTRKLNPCLPARPAFTGTTGEVTKIVSPATCRHMEMDIMDKNRKEGLKHEVKGTVKETIGKVTGNKSKEIAGNLEKNAGKLQNQVGKASDAIRNATRPDNS
jgi:uncharacterized protein YjbJ (UPF0337 family)